MRLQMGRVRKGREKDNELPASFLRPGARKDGRHWRGGPGAGKGFGFSVLQSLDLPGLDGMLGTKTGSRAVKDSLKGAASGLRDDGSDLSG